GKRPLRRVGHRGLLAAETAGKRALQLFGGKSEHFAEDAERDDILRTGRARRRAGDLRKGHRNPGERIASDDAEILGRGPLLAGFMKYERVGRDGDLAAEPRVIAPAEDDQNVHGRSLGGDTLRRYADRARGLAAADLRPVRFRLDHVE